MKRRIFALLTALCMIWTLLPAPALAAEEPHSSGYVSGCLTNPLYDHDGCSGVHGHLSAPRTYADGEESLSPEDYLTDPQAVYAAIRTGLEQRQATITVPWRISAEGIPSEPVEEQQAALGARMLEALAMAMVHTGVPTQGDYLQWHYQEVLYGANYATDGTYYYLDMSYEATYYTTAAQEAELTAALEPVMASFGFTAGTDDYTKVKAIYDYVCANVTYDYANLEDETYTLKFTAYAAMMNGTSVCQGYATLLYRMLLAAGVDNRVIVGTSGTENHAWNIVKLGDVWYNADSTWDAGQTAYGYFLKAPANFPDHTRSAEYETADFHAAYPMATADYVPEEVHTHTVTPVAAEPATCTEPGTEAHYVCSCGKLFSDAEATVEVQAADLVIDATGHTVTPVAAEPATCTEPGTEAHYVCSCGKLFSDAEATVEVQAADLVIDATGHTVTPVAAEPATCTEPGTKAHYVCSCGKLFSDAEATEEVQAADLVIDATGHTVTPVAAEPATCTEPGTKAHYVCSCGKLFSDAEATVEVQAADLVIPVTDHTWGDWVQTTPPTEDEKGEETRECSVCHTTETQDVDALGHICKNHLTAKDAVDPTCTEPGTKAHYLCSCGKLYEDAAAAVELTAADLVIPKTGHTEETIPAVPATCKETGLTEGTKCSVCGEVLVEQTETTKLDHTWGAWGQTTAPTETDKGEDTRECSVCHETETREVPALGHTCKNHLTAKDAVAPTCTEDGTKAHYVCSCGKIYEDAAAAVELTAADLVIAKTGHTEEVIPAVAATCTKTGLTEGTKCSVCGEVLVEQTETPKLDHTWGAWGQTTAPTETDKGEDSRVCSACGETETREVPALGHLCQNHLTAQQAKPASCTEPGTKAHYLCSCGKIYEDAAAAVELTAADLVIAKTGHTEEVIPAVAATCTKTGLTEGTKCSVCGEVLVAQTETPKLDHTWGAWGQTTAPTETDKGEDTRVCSACGETETREVPALGHLCQNHLTAQQAKPASCTEDGTKAHYLCSCGKIYEDAAAAVELTAADLVIAKTGHTEEVIPAVPATCKATGLTEGTKCSVCGETLVAQQTVPAKGHTEETVPAVAATCTKTGLTEGTKCSVCGETLVAQQTVPAKGHSYVNGTCSVCGGEDPGFIAGDFTGDNEVTDEDAIYLLWHTLFPEKYPLASYGSGDLTGDGLITDEDAIYLLWHTLFPEKYPLYAPAPAAASTTSDEKGKKK